MTVSTPGVALDLVLADLRELIECESPSSDLQAVARSADVVARIGASRMGAEPERIVIDGCTHLVWRHGPTKVLLVGHHDTVWPLGTLARQPFSVVDGVLRGPGCFDMSAGLVMAMHTVAALGEAGRAGVTVLVTGDEEIGSPTSRSLIEEEARGAVAALVLEASADGGALKTARKGTSMYEIHLTGRAAHAGLEPEKGINAGVELAHQVLALGALSDSEAGTTVTPTASNAGTTLNTVPAAASVSVDVRAWTVAEQERVDAAIRALTATLPGASISVRGGINRPPLEESSSRELFARASRLAEALGQPPVSATAVGGASDGNFTAGVGTPTLDGLGAVGGGAHADSEHVVVDRLVDRTILLQALVAELLEESA
ncbi:M20 family metallopeptidase [Pimelobacter simplex]|uniref:M20 family metallopeptidase n=1 Tax=Nocardioides simplex TaxID=2045 RepID=UPI003AABA940